MDSRKKCPGSVASLVATVAATLVLFPHHARAQTAPEDCLGISWTDLEDWAAAGVPGQYIDAHTGQRSDVEDAVECVNAFVGASAGCGIYAGALWSVATVSSAVGNCARHPWACILLSSRIEDALDLYSGVLSAMDTCVTDLFSLFGGFAEPGVFSVTQCPSAIREVWEDQWCLRCNSTPACTTPILMSGYCWDAEKNRQKIPERPHGNRDLPNPHREQDGPGWSLAWQPLSELAARTVRLRVHGRSRV